MNLKQSLIENNAIKLNQIASSWEDAIKIGTDILVESGAVKPCYYDTIISKIKNIGPYMTIAPGLAMPHARPEEGVIKTAFAFVTFAEPIFFEGDDEPIHILVTLAGSDADQHMQGIMEIMQIFEDNDPLNESGVDLEKFLKCQTNEDVYAIIDASLNQE